VLWACVRVLQKLEARLGISTGKAIAGVKGVLQPRFTVLGVFVVGYRVCDAGEYRVFVHSVKSATRLYKEGEEEEEEEEEESGGGGGRFIHSEEEEEEREESLFIADAEEEGGFDKLLTNEHPAGEAAENAQYLENHGVALGVHASASFLESLTGLDSSQCEHRLGASGTGDEGRAGVLLPDWSVAVGERDPTRGENTYILQHEAILELEGIGAG